MKEERVIANWLAPSDVRMTDERRRLAKPVQFAGKCRQDTVYCSGSEHISRRLDTQARRFRSRSGSVEERSGSEPQLNEKRSELERSGSSQADTHNKHLHLLLFGGECSADDTSASRATRGRAGAARTEPLEDWRVVRTASRTRSVRVRI